MKQAFAAITVTADDAEDWMVEAAIEQAIEEVLKVAAEAGAIPGGLADVAILRHQPVYNEDLALIGHEDVMRVAIDCELPEADVDPA